LFDLKFACCQGKPDNATETEASYSSSLEEEQEQEKQPTTAPVGEAEGVEEVEGGIEGTSEKAAEEENSDANNNGNDGGKDERGEGEKGDGHESTDQHHSSTANPFLEHLEVGAMVSAKFLLDRAGGYWDPTWFPGIVFANNANGTYHIIYKDGSGDVQKDVPRCIAHCTFNLFKF
jgi:hypothetical protein